MKQKPSWAGSALERVSIVGPRLPIAHIYFPTDRSILDSQDKLVLNALCQEFTMLLDLGYHVNIDIAGGADKRGSAHYNRELGARRAKAVEFYMRQRIPKKQRLSVMYHSIGEQPSDRGGLAEQRRVDIAFRKVGEVTFEPELIRSKKVIRPVQFLHIEIVPYNRDANIHYVIIIEKTALVDKQHTFPHDERQTKSWFHSRGTLIFGSVINVSRNTIKWREKRTSDSVKKIAKGIFDYAVLLAPFDVPGTSSPELGKGFASGRLGLYKSWDDYEARGSGEFLKYKHK